ncbi:MAG: hypothetical protein HYY04_16755 [Chloroflexi bacterium]|nr:hypothetical protein [Chloroflexota bacterium]
MSRPISHGFSCACSHSFRAPVYKSANVTTDPLLKERILRRDFNVVECPSCSRRIYADIPFFYHDMERHLAVWVYPANHAGREPEIRAKLARARELLSSALPAETAENERFGLDLIFGIDELIARIGE